MSNRDVWQCILNTKRDLDNHRERAALDIAEEIVTQLTGIQNHPYESAVGKIAEAIEEIL